MIKFILTLTTCFLVLGTSVVKGVSVGASTYKSDMIKTECNYTPKSVETAKNIERGFYNFTKVGCHAEYRLSSLDIERPEYVQMSAIKGAVICNYTTEFKTLHKSLYALWRNKQKLPDLVTHKKLLARGSGGMPLRQVSYS